MGQTYSAAGDRIQTIASEQTVRFLGQTYIRCRPFAVVNSQLGVRKYRGITYGL